MTSGFLVAIVDCLLPGETAAPGKGQALPSGTAAGIDLANHREAFQPLLQAVAQAAGGEEGFVSSTEAGRIEILQSVQRAEPDSFARLLAVVLPDYYEAAAVLRAFAWRIEPPQPQGHAVAPMAEDVSLKLDRVRQRGQRWRG